MLLKHFAPGPCSLHPSRNIARNLELCPLKSYFLWVPKGNSQHILHTGQQVASRTRNPLQKGSCSVFQYLHKQQQANKFTWWRSKNCVQNQLHRRGATSRQEKQQDVTWCPKAAGTGHHGSWTWKEILCPSSFSIPYISCHIRSIPRLPSGKFPLVLPEEVLSNSWVRFWWLECVILYTMHCTNILHWVMGLGEGERKTPAAGAPPFPQNQKPGELFNLS